MSDEVDDFNLWVKEHDKEELNLLDQVAAYEKWWYENMPKDTIPPWPYSRNYWS